jgi:hypothetical protein
MSDPVLQQMISDAPAKSSQIAASSSSLDAQITTLQKQQDSIQNTVCGGAASKLETYLIGTKFTPASNYLYKGPNFNQSLVSSGNLTDWSVYQKIILTNLQYLSSNSFTCSGNQTTVFTNLLNVGFLLDSTSIIISVVSSSSFDNILNLTTVIINDSILTNALTVVSKLNYTYLFGNDTTVDKYKSDWDFGHDHIIQPLGSSGTYGTQDMIAKLGTAKTLLQNNKTKIDNSITVFSSYI